MHVLKLCGEFPPAHMWIGGMRRSTALTFASDPSKFSGFGRFSKIRTGKEGRRGKGEREEKGGKREGGREEEGGERERVRKIARACPIPPSD